MAETQNFQNHRRFVPLFHGVLLPILTINLGWSIYRLVRLPSVDAFVGVLLAIGVVMTAFAARVFALRVQDRVIRLEMRLRLAGVLPAELQPRIAELTPGQLVALRFASDAELPGLVAIVFRDKVSDATAIKTMVTDWQADTLRV